jgi:threonine dehydrogenase-like Zn-dependent dehydrogenase
MKAIVFHGVGDIRLDEVPEPKLEHAQDALVRITASAICGTDLHMVRGTLPKMKHGTVLGHEGVGVVEEVGPEVRNFAPGDRVVIASTIACGNCAYCRAGYFSQCDVANPNGRRAGTAFFGGPKSSGPFDGMQAEYVRVPFSNVGMVRLPDEVSDDQAILLSDIFPTGYFAAELAEIRPGDTVAIFGCGPVGQFAIASAFMLGAGRVLAVDTVQDRLEMARRQGAEAIDFNVDDPVEVIFSLTGGIGPDRAIDAVGVDAERPHHGPGADRSDRDEGTFRHEVSDVAPTRRPEGENWQPGDAPSQALQWACEVLAKAGSLSIVGVYPESLRTFPIGQAMERNLSIRMGNCPHRRYIPRLLEKVRTGAVDPAKILTQRAPLGSALEAYRAFDARRNGWTKVELRTAPTLHA